VFAEQVVASQTCAAHWKFCPVLSAADSTSFAVDPAVVLAAVPLTRSHVLEPVLRAKNVAVTDPPSASFAVTGLPVMASRSAVIMSMLCLAAADR
jgi:hypothetical protein